MVADETERTERELAAGGDVPTAAVSYARGAVTLAGGRRGDERGILRLTVDRRAYRGWMTGRTIQMGQYMADCQLWFAHTDLLRDGHFALLDAAERSRAKLYRSHKDRARFVVGAVMARLVLSIELDVSPMALDIQRRCPWCHAPHGKPSAPGSGIHFSLSHTEYLVVLATSRYAPVGVDIESLNRRLRRGLENRILDASEPVNRQNDLLTYWCRKESVIKATGDGMRAKLSEVLVGSADGPPTLRGYLGHEIDASLTDLNLLPRFVGALTILSSSSAQIHSQSAENLLRNAASLPARSMVSQAHIHLREARATDDVAGQT